MSWSAQPACCSHTAPCSPTEDTRTPQHIGHNRHLSCCSCPRSIAEYRAAWPPPAMHRLGSATVGGFLTPAPRHGAHTLHCSPGADACREGEMMRKRAAQSLASPHFPQTYNTAVPLPWCPPTPPRPIPGQVAVLLQVRVSRSNPLHSVPYGEETQERVRTWEPCPHVSEQTLHCDHSSAAGSPGGRRGVRDGDNPGRAVWTPRGWG